MKKITRIISIFISIIALVSCKNVKIEDDYYYEETEVIDGMKERIAELKEWAILNCVEWVEA